MKKLFLFLVLVLFISCTDNVRDTCVTKKLSESEQLILSQTDSLVYKHAIIIDDEVLIFDDPAKDIIKVINYFEPFRMILLTILVSILLLLICTLFYIMIEKL